MALLKIQNQRSWALERRIAYNVLLPFDTRDREHPEGEKFKTLYLLHGVRENNETWLLNTRISELSEKYNIAVVLPNGENTFYLDNPDAENNFGRFIGEELVQRTRKFLPLSDKREDTFIGGFSMGAYGSLRNGLKYNKTFSKIVAFAPALDLEYRDTLISHDPDFLKRKEFAESHYHMSLEEAVNTDMNPMKLIDDKKDDLPSIYMVTGKNDSLTAMQNLFEEKLRSVGADCIALHGEGAHEWNFINSELEKAMAWLAK